MALISKQLPEVRPEVPTAAVTDWVRVNLNVPEATRQQWKHEAITRRTTLSDLILEAMSKHLGK